MTKGIAVSPERLAAAVEGYAGGATMYSVMHSYGVGYDRLLAALSEASVTVRAAKPRTGEHVTAPVRLFCDCGAARLLGQAQCRPCRERKAETCSCKRPIEGQVYMGKTCCRICFRVLERRG